MENPKIGRRDFLRDLGLLTYLGSKIPSASSQELISAKDIVPGKYKLNSGPDLNHSAYLSIDDDRSKTEPNKLVYLVLYTDVPLRGHQVDFQVDSGAIKDFLPSIFPDDPKMSYTAYHIKGGEKDLIRICAKNSEVREGILERFADWPIASYGKGLCVLNLGKKTDYSERFYMPAQAEAYSIDNKVTPVPVFVDNHTGDITRVDDFKANFPDKFKLYPTYPNPTNGQITIEYEVPKPCNTTLEIFNLKGELKATHNGIATPDNRNKYNVDLSSFPTGMYYYRLRAGNNIATSRFTLVK